MALKNKRSFGRDFIKALFILITIFVIGVTCLHIWFVNNAERLLIELVTEKSGGKLKLELSNLSFDIFSNEVKIHKALIASTNKVRSPITYQVSFRKVLLHTNSLWSLLINRAVEIRQIKLYDPEIEVFSWQKDSLSNSKNNLSLGMELGKLYNSIQDAISVLNTHSIFIINAKLTLVNKMDPGRSPVIFSNIYFTIKRLHKHDNNKNFIFSSSNQNITLTDGIHKLLFKRLVVQPARSSIILDSCTIIALPSQTFANNYTIFFEKLALIGVNFDTLYKTNLIKADSVYCENPFSRINLYSIFPGKKMVGKGMPDLEKIIKQFSGNLDLGFVGVRNADIHVNITGKEGRSDINSGKGNFQIKNLRIDPGSSELISIKSFDMLIKGYHLYNADSSCIYSFDSIRFANDKLLLNNFSVYTSSGINKIRNYRDYSMPYFELLGLDWSELIFRQNLKAREAILHNPTINLKKVTKVGIAKKSIIFASRHSLDDFMDIERLKIINGKVNIKWGSNNLLQLEGLNLSLSGDNLVNYRNVKLQTDIQSLFFSGGYLKLGDINARLENVIFKANDQIHAEQLFINTTTGAIDSKINDVLIKNIYTEENTGDIVIDGLKWEAGSIIVNAVPDSKNRNHRIPLIVKDVSGKQSQLKFFTGAIQSNAFVEEIHISSIFKNSKGLEISGLNLRGTEMNLSTPSLQMNCAGFFLTDTSQELSDVRFKHFNRAGSLSINAPFLQLRSNLNSFFANDLHMTYVLLQSPVINLLREKNTGPAIPSEISSFPAMKIDHIDIREPALNVQLGKALSSQNFTLPYSKENEIKAYDVQVVPGGIELERLNFKAKKAELTVGPGKPVKVDDGIDLQLAKINISTGNTPGWNAVVSKLNMKNSGPLRFDLKENKLELQDLALGDFLVSSSSVNDISTLVMSNPSAWVSTTSAKYYTKNALWQCFNPRYNASQQLFMLDSFNYHPSHPRDSVIAANPYQIDYLDFSNGTAKLYGLNLNDYFKEHRLNIAKASLSQPSISIYRDKFPPYLPGIVKKLFVEKIMDIPLPVRIDQIEVGDGRVSYTEKNAKNRLEGNFVLTHLNGNFYNIKNQDMQLRDSLSLVFTGHVLDSPSFKLKIKQSYLDSLYGFVMSLAIEPASLNFLNPLVAPLSNVKFTSGRIDKFYMSAVGNKNMAHGKMKFYYHRLRLQLLKDGETSKSSLIKQVASLFVNTFVLKTNNEGRSGLIYFERLKDRSFFNYMNKIIFSGVATSVGARKNSQYRKKITNDPDTYDDP